MTDDPDDPFGEDDWLDLDPRTVTVHRRPDETRLRLSFPDGRDGGRAHNYADIVLDEAQVQAIERQLRPSLLQQLRARLPF